MLSYSLSNPAQAMTVVPGKQQKLVDFADGAYWQQLIAEATPVAEPNNTVMHLRAPAIPEEDASTVPLKYNFAEVFDRPAFIGIKEVPTQSRNFRYSNQTTKMVVANEGGPRLDWIKTHKLGINSTPQDWFLVFLPDKRMAGEEQKFCTNNWCRYTNQKAQQAFAGSECYKEFVPFTPKDIQMHLGLYILNGLSPSPQVDMKFKSQIQDPVQESN